MGPDVRAVVTDRRGGFSPPPYDENNLGAHVGDDPAAVAANRDRTARTLGLSAGTVTWMQQEHGARVGLVSGRGTVVEPDGVDALVVTEPNRPLAVLVADCVPVLLADAEAGVGAVAHAGRAGVVAGVVPATLAVMVDQGARRERLRAVLGPAIGSCCYEVPEALQDEVSALVPATRARTRAGTAALDLRAGLAAVLRAEGVRAIEVDQRCTADDPELFSYRRDGATGRFAGYLWLTP
ncbi:MAG: peptidoglycan editing factor PgeF [Actinomycetota bacterium]|nr:peptidoglycan editing factor PgeF [Actinomycetota bacterium]